ncbi:MAG: iron-containing alcohol dehydrogenase [Clostridiales bacterium]|nr:iron-containing alcohol dehydrogenase [Clostridiales bacterium]
MDRLKANRPYDCFCGMGISLDFACSYILENSNIVPPSADASSVKVLIVSDRVVSGYYYSRFENQFTVRGIKPNLIVVEGGEGEKNLSNVNEILRYLVDFEFGSKDWIISLGGGGITDLAGFAAAVYSGRSNLMVIPTTLDSMVEGAVAREAGINIGKYKNMAKIPFAPKVVLADPVYLDSVPAKIRSNGYAAVLRAALLRDPDLLKDLRSPENLREYLDKIYEATYDIELKNPLLLTIGNDIADAIEGYFRFMNYSQGEALALSLLSAVPEAARNALKSKYTELGLPSVLVDVNPSMIIKTIRDNLMRSGKDVFKVVDYDAGKWVIRELSLEETMMLYDGRIKYISEGKYQ